MSVNRRFMLHTTKALAQSLRVGRKAACTSPRSIFSVRVPSSPTLRHARHANRTFVTPATAASYKLPRSHKSTFSSILGMGRSRKTPQPQSNREVVGDDGGSDPNTNRMHTVADPNTNRMHTTVGSDGKRRIEQTQRSTQERARSVHILIL